MNKKIYFLIFLFVFVIFAIYFLNSISYSYEPVQTVIITKEDIENAQPSGEFVKFSQKDLKVVEMLERRHFFKTYPELTDKERLKNLEYELLGRTWQYTNQNKRIDTLKIASSNVMLQGTSLPASISSKRNAKRMTNNSIQIRKKDDVGLIDGFLRLINPEVYQQFRQYQDHIYNEYEPEY